MVDDEWKNSRAIVGVAKIMYTVKTWAVTAADWTASLFRGWSSRDARRIMDVESVRIGKMLAWRAKHDDVAPGWYSSQDRDHTIGTWREELRHDADVLIAWSRRNEDWQNDADLLGEKMANARERALVAEYKRVISWVTRNDL